MNAEPPDTISPQGSAPAATAAAAPAADEVEDEALDEVGRESFPASDPPSSWAGRPRVT